MDRDILSIAGDLSASRARVLTRVLSDRRSTDIAFFLLVCAWPWIGVFGREPWKADEAYSFGLIWSVIQGKGWLVPMLAGEPFMEKPPLFYWLAALCAKLFGGPIPAHDAARIAIVVLLYATFGFVAAAGRELLGAKRGFLALILFVGCAGLFDKSHILVTDVALLAGLSMALFGLVSSERRPHLAGICLGIGTGIAFMSKGLLGLGIPAATAAALALFPAWRSRRRLQSLAIGAAIAAPALLAWPAALHHSSSELFREWMWTNNLGRFFGFARHGESHALWFYPLTLAWLAFPLWPFALAAGRAAWIGREALDALRVPAVAFAVTMATLMLAWQSRAIYALPALLPLSLVGAAGVAHAPPRGIAALQRASLWIFAVLVATLWLAWLAVQLEIPWSLSVLAGRAPGFAMPLQPAAIAFAAAGTALAWLAIRERPITAENSVRVWMAGLTAFWLVLLTLWLPYLDYRNGYRTVAASLQTALPRDGSCVASRGLGESQRAMFDYYAGLVTRRIESDPDARQCAWLLLQEAGTSFALPGNARWREIWRGSRPGDERESFHLYRTEGA